MLDSDIYFLCVWFCDGRMEGREGKGREGKGGKEGSIFSTPLGCQLVLLAVASVLNTDNLCYRI